MKKNTEMYGTDRMAIRLKNGEKIKIDRKKCRTDDEYVLSIPWYLSSSDFEITEDDLFVAKKLTFDEDNIIIDAILLKNFNYRTVYFDNNGVIDSYFEAYYPNPEENTYSKNIQIRIAEIDAFCTDLDMFNDMYDKGMIEGSTLELSKYEIYKPQIEFIKKKGTINHKS